MIVDADETTGIYRAAVTGVLSLQRRFYKKLPSTDRASLLLTAFQRSAEKVSKRELNIVLRDHYHYDALLDAHRSDRKIDMQVYIPDAELVGTVAAITSEDIEDVRCALRHSPALSYWAAIHYQARRFQTTWHFIEPDSPELISLRRWSSELNESQMRIEINASPALQAI